MGDAKKAAIEVLNSAQWPWIAKAGVGRWNVTTSGAPRTFNICSINTDREDQETIARLIAAAPDLLEACQLVIGSMKWDREDDTSREVVRRLTAALSKAGV